MTERFTNTSCCLRFCIVLYCLSQELWARHCFWIYMWVYYIAINVRFHIQIRTILSLFPYCTPRINCPSCKELQSVFLILGNKQNKFLLAYCTVVNKGGNWLNSQIIKAVINALFEIISHKWFQNQDLHLFIMFARKGWIKHTFLRVLLKFCVMNALVFCGYTEECSATFLKKLLNNKPCQKWAVYCFL